MLPCRLLTLSTGQTDLLCLLSRHDTRTEHFQAFGFHCSHMYLDRRFIERMRSRTALMLHEFSTRLCDP